jgi:hypothetical protein
MDEEMKLIYFAHHSAAAAYDALASVDKINAEAEVNLGVARSSLLQAIRHIEKAMKNVMPAAIAEGFALPKPAELVKEPDTSNL